jgi:hypothetical protein
LSVDPEVNQTGQAYQYVGNDPINSSDPSGMCTGFNISCNIDNNRWISKAQSSPTGQARVSWSQAFNYMVDNNVSKSDAHNFTATFDWSRPVVMIDMTAGTNYFKYGNSPNTAGRRFFGTPTIYTSPSLASHDLYLAPYDNYATTAWDIRVTAGTPALFGYVYGSSTGRGVQFFVATADTNTVAVGHVPTYLSYTLQAGDETKPLNNPGSLASYDQPAGCYV